MQRIVLLLVTALMGGELIFPLSFAVTPMDLKQIKHKIATIKVVLSKDQNKRAVYFKNLKSAKIAYGHVRSKLQKTETTLKKQLLLLKKLNRNQILYQKKLTAQQSELREQIRSACRLGRELYLKLILSQSDTEMISCLLMYYRYLTQTHLATIHDLQTTLSKLQTNQTEIGRQTKILQKLQHQQHEERQRLEKLKHEREQALSNLSQEIKTKSQRLAKLLDNKRVFEQTLNYLENEARVQAAMNQDFAKLQGKLPWPTPGGVVLPYFDFGTPIDQSELKWDGILISAAEEQPVYAVASGKVVFAKWLPGYGLLLIISHGHGYMTLYGRNHNLYKKPGDKVEEGDLIATVGRSGGYEKPVLYFAIRHNAKPLNPSKWCVRRG